MGPPKASWLKDSPHAVDRSADDVRGAQRAPAAHFDPRLLRLERRGGVRDDGRPLPWADLALAAARQHRPGRVLPLRAVSAIRALQGRLLERAGDRLAVHRLFPLAASVPRPRPHRGGGHRAAPEVADVLRGGPRPGEAVRRDAGPDAGRPSGRGAAYAAGEALRERLRARACRETRRPPDTV